MSGSNNAQYSIDFELSQLSSPLTSPVTSPVIERKKSKPSIIIKNDVEENKPLISTSPQPIEAKFHPPTVEVPPKANDDDKSNSLSVVDVPQIVHEEPVDIVNTNAHVVRDNEVEIIHTNQDSVQGDNENNNNSAVDESLQQDLFIGENIVEESKIQIISTRSVGCQTELLIESIPPPSLLIEPEQDIDYSFMDQFKSSKGLVSSEIDANQMSSETSSCIQLSIDEFNAIDRKVRQLSVNLTQSQKDKRVFIDTIKRLHSQMQSMQSNFRAQLETIKQNYLLEENQDDETDSTILSKITEFRERLSYAQKSVSSKKMKNLLKV